MHDTDRESSSEIERPGVATPAGTCKTCKHYAPAGDHPGSYPRLGQCDSPKWRYGYHVGLEKVPPDGILVENDEGWGAVVASGFGCIHHEEKAADA